MLCPLFSCPNQLGMSERDGDLRWCSAWGEVANLEEASTTDGAALRMKITKLRAELGPVQCWRRACWRLSAVATSNVEACA